MGQNEYAPLDGSPKKYRGYQKKMWVSGIVAGVLVLLGVVACTKWSSAAEDSAFLPKLSKEAGMDRVVNLPGLDERVKERMFSGYLGVENGGQLHYWFVESQNDTENDPVVLWLNGGPGASSIGGLLNENGPFTVNKDGTMLKRNPNAWNQNANLLYIESPIGVGFSYNASGVYASDDFLQAIDNYQGLRMFFQRFPHLWENEFQVIGESYGGVYVPTLAKQIVDGNKARSESERKINLIGFAVGNGVNEYSVNSQLYFAYYHGLIGSDVWNNLKAKCPELQEATVPDYNFFDLTQNKNPKSECSIARMQAFTMLMTSHVNTYDIYRKCSHGDPQYGIGKLLKELGELSNAKAPLLTQPIGLPFTLCLDVSGGETYMNRKDVKKALHIPESLSWSDIVLTGAAAASLKSLNLTVNPTELEYGMPLGGHVISYWKYLMENGVRGLIYHGDADFMCDFIGGQWAVDSLNITTDSVYRPWHIPSKGEGYQAAGFMKEYGPLMTFVTVKGAGHMVPQWKPEESLYMLSKFILRQPSN